MVNFIALGLLIILIIILIFRKKRFKLNENYDQEVNTNLFQTEVPKDGIRRIDNPCFLNASIKCKDETEVLAIVHKGKAFAFPINTMIYHEIINFKVGKDNVSMTYCPLSGTSRGFKGHIFGITGKLYNLNLVMYDTKTNSEIPQILGKAFNGKLKGKDIQTIQVYHTRWWHWKKLYPRSKILSLSQQKFKQHKFDIYRWYDFIARFWYPIKSKSLRFRSKEMMQCFKLNNKYYTIVKSNVKKNKLLFFTLDKKKICIKYNDKIGDVEVLQGKKRIDSFENFWFSWYAAHTDTIVL